MKVSVKLYGTLSRRFPRYRHAHGMDVEIPDGATAQDLLALLEIPTSQGAVVAMEGRLLRADDTLRCGAPVNILQAIYGG
jgi:sulfur carrier protein ThiS